MSRTSIALNGTWSGPTPTLAWILGIGETPGKALNIVYSAGRSVIGQIDIAAELRAGAGSKKMKYNSVPNKNPTPSALSLAVNQDVYLGFILDPKLGASFAQTPFSGGYAGAEADYLSATRVNDTQAYLIVKGSAFGSGEYSKPFNIHVEAKGTQGNAVPYVTPMIIDPDTRWPDGPVPIPPG